MEWYWVVTIIIGFLGIGGLLVWLGKTGKLKGADMKLISSIIGAINTVANSLAIGTENHAIDVFALAMTLIEKAVLAAENAYYNAKITAEERHAVCMQEFEKLLEAADIVLTDAQLAVVDTLISAACEAMGHEKDKVEIETSIDIDELNDDQVKSVLRQIGYSQEVIDACENREALEALFGENG